MASREWYQLSVDEVCGIFNTCEVGLTSSEANQRLAKQGYNLLPKTAGQSRIRLLLNQIQSPLIYVLIVAGFLTILLEHYIDSSVIFAVVILNSVVGFAQEYRAEEAMKRLAQMVAPKARVVRDRVEIEIDSSEIVTGDVVLLSSGAKVPADIRLCELKEIKADESLLTGESTPVEKITEAIEGKNLTPGDQKNMMFMGTIVTSGRGRGIVVETGVATQLGTVFEEMRVTERGKTPFTVRMEHFSKRIGLAILGLSALVFLLGVGLGESIVEMLLTAVSVAVSAIPEGLPAVVTITLSVGANRMAKQNAIIRKLPAVETLGGTTVICSDKTGTLTKNEMTVIKIFTLSGVYDVTGTGYNPQGDFLSGGRAVNERDVSLDLTLMIGLLCNESELYMEDDTWRVRGDPTEGALIVSAIKHGVDLEEAHRVYPRLDLIPFESERGYMATLQEYDGRKMVFVKGAPEKIFDMFRSACNVQGRVEACYSDKLLEEANKLAAGGLRVLSMAYKEVPNETQEITHKDIEEGGLIFAGYQCMIDPPRPEAVEAVQKCRRAGIRVVMITGDYHATARAIAKQMGIIDEQSEVITGQEMEAMSEEELFERVEQVSVFSRVSPHHKLRVVKSLQKHGETVAVTGDGVNDAPALKASQIGVAMGVSGTDVAREASHMVLTDDNFSSIFAAVKEGRVVFENIRKATLFLVSTGIGLVMAILASMLLLLPLPFLPAQILWINLVTNGLQDVALGFEPAEKGVEWKRPRNPREGILSRLMLRLGLVGVVLMVGTLFVFNWELSSGGSLPEARSMALTTMVFYQFFYVFICRSETTSVFKMNPLTNRYLFITVAAALVAQLLVLYQPTLQSIFSTAPIALDKLGWAVLISISIFVVEVEKIYKSMKEKTAG